MASGEWTALCYSYYSLFAIRYSLFPLAGVSMRITDIREKAIPLRSNLSNSSFDFSEMTTSIVAVITDVKRDGRPVVGFAFNSTGRYACGAQMRALYPAHSLRRGRRAARRNGHQLRAREDSRRHDA